MNGYLADYHVHSNCSPDGRSSMRELAETAIAAGLQELCFTDHVDYVDWKTGAFRDQYDWPRLGASFAEAQAACGDRITLRLGAEVSDVTRDTPRMERFLRAAPPLDFIIGSIHCLSGAYNWLDLFHSAETSPEGCRAEIADYLSEVRRLAQWGQFNVLGHLTLPLRYMAEVRGITMTFDGFEREVEEILRILIDNGCGIEVNTNRGHDPLPGEVFIRMYHSLGGELITIGSDAHVPAQVGCAISETQALLRRCGFTRFTTFSGGQPIFHPL